MCSTCGCGQEGEGFTIKKPGDTGDHGHSYDHGHGHTHGNDHHHHAHTHHYHHHHEEGDHPHQHDHPDHDHDRDQHDHFHDHGHSHTIRLEQDILSQNNLLAERNRGFFEARSIKAVNLVSSPGSGKTSLLEKTISDMSGEVKFAVIEGDQQTTCDADRIQKTGAPVLQINTGKGCHLDALMINKAVKQLDIPENSLVMIENVGNLVCPALFDLGESCRVVISSVTEGEDKPAKYPYMFHSSQVCIINKIDLLPYVDFDVSKFKGFALSINPKIRFFELSVKTGEGMQEWYDFLRSL